VSLIKTMLKGPARNRISNENTVDQKITRLRANVNGQSVVNISTRLLNFTQRNKTPNIYTQEVEKLAKSLEEA